MAISTGYLDILEKFYTTESEISTAKANFEATFSHSFFEGIIQSETNQYLKEIENLKRVENTDNYLLNIPGIGNISISSAEKTALLNLLRSLIENQDNLSQVSASVSTSLSTTIEDVVDLDESDTLTTPRQIQIAQLVIQNLSRHIEYEFVRQYVYNTAIGKIGKLDTNSEDIRAIYSLLVNSPYLLDRTIEAVSNSQTSLHTAQDIELTVRQFLEERYGNLYLNEQTPTTGFFAQFINSFFVAQSGNTVSTAETNFRNRLLWNNFVQQYKATHNNALPSDTNIQDQAEFMRYIQSSFSRSLANTALSPDEIEKRYLLSSMFEVLLMMLNKISNTIQVVSNAMIFFANWQREYTNMMNRVPIYSPKADENAPDPRNTWGLSDWENAGFDSLDRFTLGYNSISIKDVIDYISDKPAEGANSKTFVLSNYFGTGNRNGTFDLTFTYTKDANGIEKPSIQLTLYNNDSTPVHIEITGSEDTIQLSGTPGNYTATVNHGEETQFNPDDSQIIRAKKTEELFYTLLGKLEDRTDSNNVYQAIKDSATQKGPAYIPWGFNESSKHDMEKRGEQNAKLQAYIDNIRDLRKITQNQAKTMQNLLSDSKTAISQISDLMNSVLEIIRNMVGTIFK